MSYGVMVTMHYCSAAAARSFKDRAAAVMHHQLSRYSGPLYRTVNESVSA